MNRSLEILAIVPARGGSKGIPGKNLVPLAGKPLLAHTLQQAHKARCITRLVVSTDSAAIADEARRNGAEAVQRPAEICGDEASSESALLHCLDHLKANENYEPDLVVFLQATSPLRRASHMEEAVDLLLREEADSLFSAAPMRGFLWRCREGRPEPLNYDPAKRPRRQEAPDDVVENGAIYVFRPWVLTSLGCRLGGKISVYRMAAADSVEVDEPGDLPLAEWLLKRAGAIERRP